jgi:DNA-binding NarL/FixJ family response regulator
VSIRVLVCDDEALVRTGFRLILNAQPGLEVVGEADDGAAAVEAARRLRPDVVVMDIRMPVLDGVEATRRLAGPGVADPVKVLILTTFDLDEYVYDALTAGASGFLLKDTPHEQLVQAIRVVAAGEALLAPSVTRRLLDHVVPRLRPATPTPPPGYALLTEREAAVFELLTEGRSNAEIGRMLAVGEETVKSHVSHVLAKLGVRDRVQAVVLAHRSGLAWGLKPPPARGALAAGVPAAGETQIAAAADDTPPAAP